MKRRDCTVKRFPGDDGRVSDIMCSEFRFIDREELDLDLLQ